MSRKKILLSFLCTALALFLLGLLIWQLMFRYYVYTDDAYVEGNQIVITPSQQGVITAIFADDTSWVEEGQKLVELDSTVERLALESAKRELKENKNVEAAIEKVKAAWFRLERCTLYAPVKGIIARKSAQVGMFVKAGEPLMSVIDPAQVWVSTNFKETQVRKIGVGQKVELYSDFYGVGVLYHGVVAGLPAGAGSAFSTLPSQNLSGNWIKIVQRLPLRVYLDPEELKKHPLALGLSMEAKVLLKEKDAAFSPPLPVYKTSIFTLDESKLDAEIQNILKQK